MNNELYGVVYKRRIDVTIGAILALAYLALLLSTSQVGVCRDETYYFYAGQRYFTWVRLFADDLVSGRRPMPSLQRKKIDEYWLYNWEHPPLAKLMIGASHWFFTQHWNGTLNRLRVIQKDGLALNWAARFWNDLLDRMKMSETTAFRFAGMFWGSLMILIVYVWGVRVWNRRVGLFAAFALMLLPRFFFHAHLAAFDVPISSLWLLVAYSFWRGMKSNAWAIWCGVFFGLSLATKHNTWILPAPLGIYWLCQTWNRFRLKILPDDSYQIRFPPLPTALFSSIVFAPIFLFGLWPLIWPTQFFDLPSWKVSFTWLARYVNFHLQHVHYDAYYFGTLYMEPPFPVSFPFGMTAVTFPLVTVVLILGGTWFVLRQQRVGTHLIWWIIRTSGALWSLLRPLINLLIFLLMLVIALLIAMSWLILKCIEQLVQLMPGDKAAKMRKQVALWAENCVTFNQRIRQWPLQGEQPTSREYRPRPVGPADKTMLFWLLNALIPMIIIALPSSPIFGGTKHWMPAWPFLALLAAVCFERIFARMRQGWLNQKTPQFQTVMAIALAVLFLSPAAIGMIRSHPHQIAYYNTLIGGPRGSATWKLQRTFWAPHTMQILPWVNRELGAKHQGRSVWIDFHDSNAYDLYRRENLLHPAIREWRVRDPSAPSQAILFIHQKWLHNQLYHSLLIFGARAPSYGIYLDQAPLVTVWERTLQPNPVRW